MRHRGIPMNHGFGGVYGFDAPDAASYGAQMAGWLPHMAEGGLLMCHPASGVMEGDAIGKQRPVEFEYLMSDAFGDLLQRGGVAEPEQEAYWLFHKAAFSFLTAYSGPITLYYGEEIGQELPGFAAKVGSGCIEVGQCDDHVARSSAVIEGVAPEVGKPASQLNARQQDLKKYLSTLMALRAAHPALYDGSRAHIYDDNTLYLDLKAATLKTGGKEQILYLLNTRDEPKRLRLAAEVVKGAKAMRDLLTGERVTVNGDGEFILPAPGITGRFLLLEP